MRSLEVVPLKGGRSNKGHAFSSQTTTSYASCWFACSKIKIFVKRILRRYGYPPDLQDEAVQAVLLQAESLCKDWAA